MANRKAEPVPSTSQPTFISELAVKAAGSPVVRPIFSQHHLLLLACLDAFFFVRARCLSAGLRSCVLLADQRGIEPPPAACQRHKSAAVPIAPRGRLLACLDASLFTVGSMDAPCWLLYHGPIVS